MKVASLKIKKTEKHGTTYYTIFVPSYLTADKKRRQLYFRSKVEAEKKRAELIAATRTESRETVLTNAQIVDAKRALERLAEAGLSMSLDRAVELALPTLRSSGQHVPLDSLLTEFAEVKQSSWRPHSFRNFRVVANMAREAFAGLSVAEVTPKRLSEWLNSFGRPAYALGLVRTLRPAFSYAVRQGMLPDSPFSKLEPIRTPARAGIDIFTPTEARKLMETAAEDCKPAYALLLFAGIRPVELTRLKWGAIRDGFIYLTPDVTKTAQVRNVEIETNLAAWLKASGTHKPEDPICPRNWKRKNQATRRAAGLADRQDVARHSYATYHLVKYRDRATLEANLGHSTGSAMLFRHYRAAATLEQAESFWSILPAENE